MSKFEKTKTFFAFVKGEKFYDDESQDHLTSDIRNAFTMRNSERASSYRSKNSFLKDFDIVEVTYCKHEEYHVNFNYDHSPF